MGKRKMTKGCTMVDKTVTVNCRLINSGPLLKVINYYFMLIVHHVVFQNII